MVFRRCSGGYTGDFLKRARGPVRYSFWNRKMRAPTKPISGAVGIAGSEVMRFEREGKRPDGSAVKVGFLAAPLPRARARSIFISPPASSIIPENFWNPAFQKHANSVSGIAGVIVVADKPARHVEFHAKFRRRAGANGQLTVSPSPPRAARSRWRPRPPSFIGTASIRRMFHAAQDWRHCALPPPMQACCKARRSSPGLAGLYAGNAAVIGQEDAMGAVLIFERRGGPAR